MKRTLLTAFGSLVLGLFLFLLIAPLHPTFAVGKDATCRTSVKSTDEIFCDANLTCDTSADKSRQCANDISCTGVCRSPCSAVPGSPPNGGCASNEACTASSGGTGVCVATTKPQNVPLRGACISSSTLGGAGANAAQGNCAAGLVCNTASNDTCDSTAGGCVGMCFPGTYSCNAPHDTRKGIMQFDCPANEFTCNESTKNKPIIVSGQDFCPGCIFACVPKADIEYNCQCDNPEAGNRSLGSGNNGFICTNGITEPRHFRCSRSELGCYNNPNATMTKKDIFGGDTVKGVECKTPVAKYPPAPPCNYFNPTTGRCESIVTSFGVVGTDPAAFITRLFSVLLGVAGSIALLLIMRAGYRIMSARGNQEGIQQGREQLVAAIVGLLFLIFSFVLLQVIGVDLLKIPSFESTKTGQTSIPDRPGQDPSTNTNGRILNRGD